MNELELWIQLAHDAVAYVEQRRHGRFKDTDIALQNLEKSVDMFLANKTDADGIDYTIGD